MLGWGWGDIPQPHNCSLHNVTHTGQRVSMSEWLRAQGLLWMLPFHLWLILTHFLSKPAWAEEPCSSLALEQEARGPQKSTDHTLLPQVLHRRPLKPTAQQLCKDHKRETQKITTAQQPVGYLKPPAEPPPQPPPPLLHSVEYTDLCAICTDFLTNYCFTIFVHRDLQQRLKNVSSPLLFIPLFHPSARK